MVYKGQAVGDVAGGGVVGGGPHDPDRERGAVVVRGERRGRLAHIFISAATRPY